MLSTFHLLFLPIFSLAFPPAKTVYKRWKSGASDYHTHKVATPYAFHLDSDHSQRHELQSSQSAIYLFSIQSHSQYKKSHVLLHDSFQNYLLNFADKNLNSCAFSNQKEPPPKEMTLSSLKSLYNFRVKRPHINFIIFT